MGTSSVGRDAGTVGAARQEIDQRRARVPGTLA
jgi:hypothetical protein